LTIVALATTLTVIPVMFTPYQGDDLANRSFGSYGIREGFRIGFLIVEDWMGKQGRFFPGGVFLAVPVWTVFNSRVAYMAFLVLLNLVLLVVVGLGIRWLSQRTSTALMGMLTLAACMQLRFALPNTFDGFFSFNGVVPFSLLLLICACAGAIMVMRTGRLWVAAPTVFVWVWAMTTYEVSFLMLPAVLCIVLAFRAASRSALWASVMTLVVPWIVLGLYVRNLRAAAAGHTIAAYTIDLRGPVFETSARQFLGALPMSQYFLGGTPSGVHLDRTLLAMTLVFVAVPLVLAQARPSMAIWRGRARVAWALVFAGIWAWLIPSVLAGITVRWQFDLLPGQAYVYVVYECLGLALLLSGVHLMVTRPSSSSLGRLAALGMVVIVACLVAMTVAANFQLVGGWVPGPQGPT
jgi:hypothetical protein